MIWSLPVSVEIDGKEFAIRNKCDYRVVLDCINAISDESLELQYRVGCAISIFYEKYEEIENVELAYKEMMHVINIGKEDSQEECEKPKIMDWTHDFQQIAPPISRVLGYSVRDANKYTHWWDFVGAYMEIGECSWSNIVAIRSKRISGKKLESWEQDFYRQNKKLIDLPQNLTEEEQEWLDSDW